jgi:hypothetical protein
LARLFTEYNAEKNFPKTEIPAPLTAHTEPLLAGPADYCWDLILTNIPAKAGMPVLEDFVRRSVELLAPGGRAIMVAVNTLADFFRSLIDQHGALIREEIGKEHTVFVYQKLTAETEVGDADGDPVIAGEHFIQSNPFYLRSSADYEMEDTGYHIDAVHGAAEFDRPGGAAVVAAKLVSRLGLEKICPLTESARRAAILIYESGQGHFPAWLLRYCAGGMDCDAEHPVGKDRELFLPKQIVLSGRNILALEAARHNTKVALAATALAVPALAAMDMLIQGIPSTELPMEHPANLTAEPGAYSFIVAFPETVPGEERLTALWEGLAGLLLPGGTALIALPSSEAEKFDRKKPGGFTRLGDIKRQGFRALAYRKN